MSAQVWFVFLFTFIIYLIGALSYALRIAGVRTGKVAVSLALFNVLALASRLAHSFQVPLLAKHVERNILEGTLDSINYDFRLLLVAPPLATVVGALLLPTFQRQFTRAITAFNVHRSVLRLIFSFFTSSGLRDLRSDLSFPRAANVTQLFQVRPFPVKILVLNALANALLAVGVFASLYAGCLNPELRMTANSLSFVVNGFSTVMLFAFVDPCLSLLTDDVIDGKLPESNFRACLTLFILTRFAGTLIAQLLFVPAAEIIVRAAQLL
jgi:hypothetical protein